MNICEFDKNKIKNVCLDCVEKLKLSRQKAIYCSHNNKLNLHSYNDINSLKFEQAYNKKIETVSMWHKDGLLHRENGPALTTHYINNIYKTETVYSINGKDVLYWTKEKELNITFGTINFDIKFESKIFVLLKKVGIFYEALFENDKIYILDLFNYKINSDENWTDFSEYKECVNFK